MAPDMIAVVNHTQPSKKILAARPCIKKVFSLIPWITQQFYNERCHSSSLSEMATLSRILPIVLLVSIKAWAWPMSFNSNDVSTTGLSLIVSNAGREVCSNDSISPALY